MIPGHMLKIMINFVVMGAPWDGREAIVYICLPPSNMEIFGDEPSDERPHAAAYFFSWLMGAKTILPGRKYSGGGVIGIGGITHSLPSEIPRNKL